MLHCFGFRCQWHYCFQTLLISSVLYREVSSFSLHKSSRNINTAAQHCTKKGGQRLVMSTDNNITSENKVAYCKFEDGRECEEWHFYETGECERTVGARRLMNKWDDIQFNIYKKKMRARSTKTYFKLKFYRLRDCKESQYVHEIIVDTVDTSCKKGGCFDLCSATFDDGTPFEAGENVLSIRIEGNGEIDLYELCMDEESDDLRYFATIMPTDGCTNIFSWPPLRHIKFKSSSLQKQQPNYVDDFGSKYHIVYNSESSTYFGYQVHAGYYAFLTSGQSESASYTRLLTSSEVDDMADTIPTFVAKRHPFSKRYGPYNKADAVAKWFASAQTPSAEIIVVIDPDNWLLQDLEPIVNQVKKGHAVAQGAFFYGWGYQSVLQLWHLFCLQNCDWHLDLASVPYFVHKDDLSIIAPLWKYYTEKIKENEEADPQFKIRFSNLQVDWCAEMYGYVFAAAHAGVKHEIMNDLQVRDVESRPPPSKIPYIPMIHVGRAWFPHDYEPGKKWMHTEGRSFSNFGMQVWCKCNITANDVLPWPIAPGTDFQSNATLYMLYKSREMFGKPPFNKYRKRRRGAYHSAFP